MYCPYCGKKISSDARFCMYCGKNLDKIDRGTKNTDSSIHTRVDYGKTPLQNAEKHRETASVHRTSANGKKRHKKRRLTAVLLAAVVAGCAAITACIVVLSRKPSSPEAGTVTISSSGEKDDFQREEQTVSAQEAEQGLSSQETGRQDDPSVSLPSEKSDPLRGTVNPITAGDAMYPIVSDGNDVYFAVGSGAVSAAGRIYRVPAAGGTPEKIYELQALDGQLFYHDGWLYCSESNEGTTFKISVDGSQRVDLLDEPASVMDITDQAIYLCAGGYLEEPTYYRMNLDGTDCKELPVTDYLPDDVYANDMNGVLFLNGWIYFDGGVEEEPGVIPFYIQRVTYDGSKYERLCRRTYPDAFVTDGEYVYMAKDREYDAALEKLKIGDTEAVKVSDSGVYSYNIWYLNGCVSNVNTETGEQTDYLFESTGSGTDYSIEGWHYYVDNGTHRLTDETNQQVYSIENDGTVSLVTDE